MKKRSTKLQQALRKGNFLWRYKTSNQNFLNKLNSYDFQSELDSKSDFGERIYCKKLFEAVYGNYLIQSAQTNMNFWNVILENEQRLDVILFRAHIFQSLGSIYQAIKNGNVYVNGRRIFNSYKILKAGDIINLCPHYFLQNFTQIEKKLEELKKNTLFIPIHLQVDYKTATVIVISFPEEGEFPFLIS